MGSVPCALSRGVVVSIRSAILLSWILAVVAYCHCSGRNIPLLMFNDGLKFIRTVCKSTIITLPVVKMELQYIELG